MVKTFKISVKNTENGEPEGKTSGFPFVFLGKRAQVFGFVSKNAAQGLPKITHTHPKNGGKNTKSGVDNIIRARDINIFIYNK